LHEKTLILRKVPLKICIDANRSNIINKHLNVYFWRCSFH